MELINIIKKILGNEKVKKDKNLPNKLKKFIYEKSNGEIPDQSLGETEDIVVLVELANMYCDSPIAIEKSIADIEKKEKQKKTGNKVSKLSKGFLKKIRTEITSQIKIMFDELTIKYDESLNFIDIYLRDEFKFRINDIHGSGRVTSFLVFSFDLTFIKSSYEKEKKLTIDQVKNFIPSFVLSQKELKEDENYIKLVNISMIELVEIFLDINFIDWVLTYGENEGPDWFDKP